MITVMITRVPFGQLHNAKRIASMTIVNVGGNEQVADYRVRYDRGPLASEYRTIENHDRREPIESLVAKAFDAITEEA